jgi:hypothetical protein
MSQNIRLKKVGEEKSTPNIFIRGTVHFRLYIFIYKKIKTAIFLVQIFGNSTRTRKRIAGFFGFVGCFEINSVFFF